MWALTFSDYQLALKYFLRAIEMQTDPNHKDSSNKCRAWWGVKLVRRLSQYREQTLIAVGETAARW